MMVMPLSEAAQVLDARQWGADVTFRGISIDSRTLSEGNLFVALKGPNFDGHDYIEQARQCGAVAAAVSRRSSSPIPLLEVEDTHTALAELATHWRSRFNIPLIAVTGSNGKTSVKEMLASILRGCGETLVTRGNLNNDIGVPLTLFRLAAEHEYAVLELGANHPGEIAYLTDIARPTVGLVNNAGPAHLEGFGDLSGVAKAKGELFERLALDAVCIINADDAFAGLWTSMASPRRIISFGLSAAAEVTANWSGDISGSDVELMTPAGTASLRLALPGRHNVMNALAATAAGLALDIALEDIVSGLAAVRPVGGRWQARPGIHGAQLIDDTYNANPASLQVALDLLSETDAETWLVLGDMGELGEEGKQLHRKVGKSARQARIRQLFALGKLAEEAAEAFGEGAETFADMEALIARLKELVRTGVIVLVKGSRAMRMERVLEALSTDEGDA
jgi:UDP-N-acetylmuramoyl-tripeptide--D-alanyl-D-alanine ligase